MKYRIYSFFLTMKLILCSIIFLINNVFSQAEFLSVELTLERESACDDKYKIKVVWKVASEINLSHYLVKRGGTVSTLGNIANVPAVGIDNETSEYVFIDNYPPFGMNYYRIDAVDVDGGLTSTSSFDISVPVLLSVDWKYQGKNNYVEIASTSNDANSYVWHQEVNYNQGVHICVLPFEIKTIYLELNNGIIYFTTRSNNESGTTFMNKVEVNVNEQGYVTIYDGNSKNDVVWLGSQFAFSSIGQHNLKVKIFDAFGEIFYREYNIITVSPSQGLFFDNYCNSLRVWDGTSTKDIPVIISEGFDSYNTRTEQYYRFAGGKLIDCLLDKGFKVYVLNYKYNSQDIRNNAAVYASAVRYISSINDNLPIIAGGISMGGVISRYALAKAENDGNPLPVSKWISIDAPQQGAHIPRTFQDFHKNSTEDSPFAAFASNNSAAKELLTYNAFDPDGTIHTAFYSELNSLNGDGYPHLTENIGVSFSNDQPNNVIGLWLTVDCIDCPSFLESMADLPQFFHLEPEDKVAGSKLPKIDMEPIGLEQSTWGGEIQVIIPNYQEIVFKAGGTGGNNYPTFIPHESSLDLINGQSKFDMQIVPSVTSYHDIIPDDIIKPIVTALISDYIFLQNKTITNSFPIYGQKYYVANKTITAGKSVTNTLPQGNFTIAGSANVKMQAGEEIIFSDGFFSEGELYAFIAPIDVDCADDNIFLQKKTANPDTSDSESITENIIQTNKIQNFHDDDYLLQYQTSNKNKQSTYKSSIANPKSGFSIIPNPSANGIFSISGIQFPVYSSVTIYSVLGELVFQYPANHSTSDPSIQKTIISAPVSIDLSTYPKGIYFVKIYDGDEINVQKIIYQ